MFKVSLQDHPGRSATLIADIGGEHHEVWFETIDMAEKVKSLLCEAHREGMHIDKDEVLWDDTPPGSAWVGRDGHVGVKWPGEFPQTHVFTIGEIDNHRRPVRVLVRGLTEKQCAWIADAVDLTTAHNRVEILAG